MRFFQNLAVMMFSCFLLLSPLCASEESDADEKTKTALNDNAYSSLTLLMHVMQLLHENYVDEGEVSYKEMIDDALAGMVRGLDPYSTYLDSKKYNQFSDSSSGVFGGIGVVLIMTKDGLEMLSVREDGPAAKAGVLEGDFITHVNSKPVKEMGLRESVGMLKGAEGTKVELKVFRPSDDKKLDLLVEREIIKVNPISISKVMEGNIGYIHLNQFSRPTAEMLDKALIDLEGQGIKALVFDLRNNPGGFIDSAVQVCSRFIDKDKLVVYTQGRKKKDKVVYKSVNCAVKITEIPMVVLVNDSSASASEIVAGCLKDYNRAVLIGEKTFGKGSVQTVVDLSNKGAVKFTIAKYYTPNEYVIHKAGIEPDIKVEVEDENKIALNVQISKYPGTIFPEGEKVVFDAQLKRAIDVLKGVMIYQESGI